MMWPTLMAFPVCDHHDDRSQAAVTNSPMVDPTRQSNDLRFAQVNPMRCPCNLILSRTASLAEFNRNELVNRRRRYSIDNGENSHRNLYSGFHRHSLPTEVISDDQRRRLQAIRENGTPANAMSLNARRWASLPGSPSFSRLSCICERRNSQAFMRNAIRNNSDLEFDHHHIDINPWQNILGTIFVKFLYEELRRRDCGIACINGQFPTDDEFELLFQCTTILALKFSKHPSRRQIENAAYDVFLRTLTYSSYKNLLLSICPPDRMSAERLVALFYFSVDISLRSLQQDHNSFCYIVEWTKEYVNGLNPACIRSSMMRLLEAQKTHRLAYALTSACIAGFMVLFMVISHKDFHWRK